LGIKGRRELHIPDLIKMWGGREEGRGVYILIFEGAYYRASSEDKHSGVLITGMRAQCTCYHSQGVSQC